MNVNTLLEGILKAAPHLKEEFERFRAWGKEQFFQPGGIVPKRDLVTDGVDLGETQDTRIVSSIEICDLDEEFAPSPIEIASSEEEMIKSWRNVGDRFFRTDINKSFVFIGGCPNDPDNYVQLLPLAEEEVIRTELEQAYSEYMQRTAAAILQPNTGIPDSAFNPEQTPDRFVSRDEDGRLASRSTSAPNPEETAIPQIIYPNDCKFYNRSGYIRCAPNPSALTCDFCTDFEPKGK